MDSSQFVTKKYLKDAIDEAIMQIVSAITKTMATKDDLKELATKEDLNAVSHELNAVKEELKGDIKDVKRSINDLKADTPTPQEIQNHEKRILKLETAVFPA